MAGPNDERVFPHDPELDEPEAAALLNEMTARPSPEPDEPAPAPTPFAPARRVPVIEPLNPDEWQTYVPVKRGLRVDGKPLEGLTVKCLAGDDFVKVIMAYGAHPDVLLPEVRAAMCGVHPAVIAGLDADDQARVVAACRPFLPRSLQDDPDEVDIVASALDATRDWPT